MTATQGLGEDTTRLPGGNSYGANSFLGNLSYINTRSLTTGSNCNEGMKGNQILNTGAFTLIGQKIGVLNDKTAPRGYCFGPHFVNTDLSIDKNWKVTEKINMQLRVDLFDMFNHPNMDATNMVTGTPIKNVNCGTPTGSTYQPCSPTNNVITRETMNTGNFGNATQTIGKHGRELQYGLRITF
jgi:hypothetical protein